MVRIGLMGAGFMGHMHANCYANIPEAQVVAVADIQREKAEEVAAQHGAKVYTTFGSLLKRDDLDAVDICLPTYMHAKYAVKVAQRGLNMLLEKPLALTMRNANRIVAAVRESGVKCMVAHVIRFWPEYQVLKRYVDEGSLGKLRALSMQRAVPEPLYTWDKWMCDPRKSGGAIVDLHIHDADFVRYLLGEPEKVDSTGAFIENRWDYVFTNYHYPDTAVSAHCGWVRSQEYGFNMSYRALFEQGTLEYHSANTPTLTLYRRDGTTETPDIPAPELPEAQADAGGNISDLGGYFNECQYFVQCLDRGEEPSLVTVEDALGTIALIQKEVKSATKKLKAAEKA